MEMEPLQGPKMKRHARIPALLLAAALLVTTGPAYPGGRDVPDAKNSGANESDYRAGQMPASCGTDGVDVQVGLLWFEVQVDVYGRSRVRPSFFGPIGRLVSRLVGGTGDSCPEE